MDNGFFPVEGKAKLLSDSVYGRNVKFWSEYQPVILVGNHCRSCELM
jgi:hypothetical protein